MENSKNTNVYQKLQQARVQLQDMNLKKTGKNKYSNFEYYELSDLLPAINAICNKIGILTRFSIVGRGDNETAVLVVFNTDKIDESITFTLPTAEVEIGKKKDGTGGAEPIQNLGGKTTYMRRYMNMIAFEVVESEMVDLVNRSLTEEMEQKDVVKVESAKTEQELLKVCSSLKTKYKSELIKPHFDKRKEELQDNVKKVEK